MEELQEADVLWPESETTPPPPSRGAHLPVLVLQLQGAAAPVLPSRGSSTSTATPFGRRRRSDVASTAAWLDGDDDDDVQAEEFQEADVLWPDDDDAGGEDTARDHQLDDEVGEFWWLSGEAGSRRMDTEAAAAAGERLLSSPIDIPTRDRDPTTVLVHLHRRRRR
ncbi:hypothetical protein OsI_20648 [Oryza sativa Indica Group]|jgi:hypothetical protein|uniref:Uncharacterized protein n=1 Tax=Oryza sativa subsp. indica TaxID=39946 RepID=A2Y6K6_ORYSI|nr:hypothetical protein OsI_20648 [Oryza sativa Indica Group]